VQKCLEAATKQRDPLAYLQLLRILFKHCHASRWARAKIEGFIGDQVVVRHTSGVWASPAASCPAAQLWQLRVAICSVLLQLGCTGSADNCTGQGLC
jgi:hypothetical protein